MPTVRCVVSSEQDQESGRRDSNPQPTAWKAVTLPLSYSRLRVPLVPLARRSASRLPNLRRFPTLDSVSFASPLRGFGGTASACLRSHRFGGACPAEARSPSGERKLVARGGFEPPKPQGRQIYSLLRLTASLPPRIFHRGRSRTSRGLELAEGIEPPTR